MPKILYFVTEDWFFASHFLPMARAAASAGFEVVVATKSSEHAGRIKSEGFRLIEVRSERKSLGIFGNARQFIQAYSVVRDEKPDIVHCIALRSVVIGAIAARLAKTPMVVIAPTGLGYLWLNENLTFRIARSVVRALVGSWLRGPHARYVFENEEDPLEFGLRVDDADVTIVGGSGVDPRDFPVCPEPAAPPVKIALVSRMIRSKGIEEAIAAVRRARVLGAEIELSLFGDPDPSNRASFSEELLRGYSAERGVHWRGATRDVARVWREHHVALLLSYREGLPRSLVEAAAAGRPIVTSDVVGCRELVRDQKEGFLVRRGDIERAARVLTKLAEDPSLRSQMGTAANARFHERYTEAAVTSKIGTLYRLLIDQVTERTKDTLCTKSASENGRPSATIPAGRGRGVLRILHAFKVFPPDVWGGIPEAIAYLSSGMQPRYRASVLVARSRGWGTSYVWNDVPVEALSSFGTIFSTPIAPAFPFALANRSRTVDLVALHQPFPLNDFAVAIGFPDDKPLVLHWHSEILGREPIVKLLMPLLRHTIARADRIVVSHETLIKTSPLLKDAAPKCVVIPFGIDRSYWSSLDQIEQHQVEALRAKFPRLIVSTGRLVPYKGFDVLIDAMRQVDAVAVIVGSGPMRDPLLSQAQKCGISDRVIFPGSLSRQELKILLHAAKLYVLSSTSSAETFSIAQLEAMAAGLPIVNTDLPTGVPHVARHELEALTVAPNSAAGLAGAISRLLSDQELSNRLSLAGRSRVRVEYSLELFVERTRQLYEDVLNVRRQS